MCDLDKYPKDGPSSPCLKAGASGPKNSVMGKVRREMKNVQEIFFGVSADGVNYQGYAVSGQDPQWMPWQVWYTSFTGDSSVWFLWRFASDDDSNVGPGVVNNMSRDVTVVGVPED